MIQEDSPHLGSCDIAWMQAIGSRCIFHTNTVERMEKKQNEPKTMTKLLLMAAMLSIPQHLVWGQTTERSRPAAWNDLVQGGRFMDRYLPLPDLGGMTTDVWGTADVVPRDVNNGIEEKDWSYWGGNTRLMDDGKYHLFVCRWRENAPLGHMAWKSSTVVHAVADHPQGPYVTLAEVGPGHNPEWYISASGKYVIYVVDGYYEASHIDGPWEHKTFEFDLRDRYSESKPHNFLHNLTFAQREDGSYLMVNRKGDVWMSSDGLSAWNRITDGNVYPPVEGKYEDPCVWKTNVQYHLVVNDWLGRIAWYLRSKDGVKWKVDPGEAYVPGIARYENGRKENWFKYERVKVLQDEYGRATQANFAVIDTLKRQDLPNDSHSSKLICIPMTAGRLLTVLNKKTVSSETRSIRVKVQAEKGFDPHTDIDVASLRFGASEEVNVGRGCKALSTKPMGRDLVITFDGSGNGLTEEHFAGKLIGRTSAGSLLFGYSKLPGVSYIEPILSTRLPRFTKTADGYKVAVEIENFGQVASKRGHLQVLGDLDGTHMVIAKGKIPPIKPFESTIVELVGKSRLEVGKTYDVSTVIRSKRRKPEFFTNSVVF